MAYVGKQTRLHAETNYRFSDDFGSKKNSDENCSVPQS